jgi:hypothetical protein
LKQYIINGQELDLSDDGPIALTLQVNNISELQDRQASTSNEIEVPPTEKNKIILGNPDLVSSFSKKPYQKLQTSFLENGIVIVPDGVTVISEFSDGKYKLQLYSGILDFFTKIKDKKLSDLNLSSLDHIWRNSAASASKANTNGFIYPILQTGALAATGGDFNIKYQVPSVYLHTIIDEIFVEAGYTKVGKIFSDDFYKRLVVQCNGALEYPEAFIDSRTSVVGTYSVLKHDKTTLGGGGSYWGPFIFPFNNEQRITTYNNSIIAGTYYTGYSDGLSNCFNPNTYKYVANGSFKLKLDVLLPVDIPMDASDASIKISLKKNGTEIGSNFQDVTAGGSGSPRYQVLRIDNVLDICQPGDEYWVTFEIHNPSVFTLYHATVPSPQAGALAFTRDNIYFKVTVVSAIDINMKLPISMILPDMTQTDLIKAWAQMFGIIFQPEALTNTMQCVQFKEIPKSLPIDWSRKLDIGKKVKILYRYDGYAQVNKMVYAAGERSEKSGVGDGSFLIDDQTLDASKDVISLPFQASDSTVVLDGITCAQVPEYTPNTTGGYDYQTIKPRIFAIKKVTKDLLYKDGVNTDISDDGANYPVAYFNDPGQQFNLSFDNNLKDSNYTELINALDKCKIVRAYFYLTETDVQNLDFFRQVYVEYFGDMFYVNIVEEYQAGKSTLVELVRL